jgi:protein-S-isoprenylcysteine O-methyltransferase Ste14
MSSVPQQPGAAGSPLAVRIGNVLFRYRNAIGPGVFLLALVLGRPRYSFGRADVDALFDAGGIALALLGQALRVLTIGYEYIERGGRNRQVHASTLVQGGVFGHCRNPLYVGNALMAFGFALIVHSYAFYLVVVPFVLFTYGCIVAAEEEFLQAKFGLEYTQYCARVNRWWPHWSGWQRSTEGMRFNWRRVLVKEYNTMFLLVFSLGVLKLWSEYVIEGPRALPPTAWLVVAFGIWLALYLLVRSLKKTGLVKV